MKKVVSTLFALSLAFGITVTPLLPVSSASATPAKHPDNVSASLRTSNETWNIGSHIRISTKDGWSQKVFQSREVIKVEYDSSTQFNKFTAVQPGSASIYVYKYGTLNYIRNITVPY
ncbi:MULTISPECIES: hypothetical protein [Brevibacillus]|uniref:BogP n=1 Tax=Brevibacillus laterosporus TaxID=1465 RepID=A0A2H4R0W1_BRELA|nr:MULTISPECIES: hypothetical protein [Brevibacillus]ATO50313.1 hypothetical protein BrL25_15205 [Brevibacillus laterosporus DSM 25]ATY37603.1 BogP [Brevibacillus laterosporus]AYB39499.1 hypothetical protein D5F52_15105 [Brevibacillus laterosporus]MBG9774567.1 hypothetical protein [Brevibacillus laterosporus]MBG9786818.1 hypothetical protein [Brevibacillus laterosporus]